jgi:hypothetical protein
MIPEAMGVFPLLIPISPENPENHSWTRISPGDKIGLDVENFGELNLICPYI